MSIYIGNAYRGSSSFCLANLFTNGQHRNAKAFVRGLLQIFFTTNYRFEGAGDTVYLIDIDPIALLLCTSVS